MNLKPAQSTATIGALLRREREGRGWTLADLAERTGIPQPNLSRLERGLADVRLSTVIRVAQALGAEISLAPAGRLRRLDDVVRDAEQARERILAVGLAGSDPWARLARRARLGEDTEVEAEALRRTEAGRT
jgi:transcriptional regulator with XRE-family HTH domain